MSDFVLIGRAIIFLTNELRFHSRIFRARSLAGRQSQLKQEKRERETERKRYLVSSLFVVVVLKKKKHFAKE